VALLKRLGLYRGTLVISFHGTDVRPLANVADKWIKTFCYRHADALVACSASLADRMASTLGIDRARIEVIFNGADTAVFHANAPATSRLTNTLPETYVVNVGSFVPLKAHADLLEAFALAFRDRPALHLCLAGADGPTLQSIRVQAENLGLASRVHFFIGLEREDVAHLLAKASLCVQPSLSESLPLAVIEAGAVGVPVAVSDIPGHDELVREGETGHLFRAKDPTHCAEVMTKILADPVAAHELAMKFRQRVHTTLTWEACVNRYKALYIPL
jgi:glycosyltransferase involved in cell wall biosynthesis